MQVSLSIVTVSQANNANRDVVVVGAGPVGLSLALGLARRGRRVLVLEKNEGTSEHSRAPGIWPATQEILSGLGVIDDFLREGTVLRRLEIRDVDNDSILFSAPLEELADLTRYPHLLILPQSQTETFLLKALQRESTAEVRFSCEVTGLVQDESKVVVRCREPSGESSVNVRFVAGCDGAHSAVRKTIGMPFEGETYKIQAALADIEIDAGPDLPFPRFTTRPRPAIGIKMRGRLWRLILPFAGDGSISLERRIDDAVASLFKMNYRPVWQSEFRLHRRISSSFADGRIALAGDAAHLNSPVGGQGMNSGIQDAALLTEALIEALDRDATEPLTRYAEARQEEIRTGVNRFTDLLTRTLLARRGRMLRPTFRLANMAMRIPPLRRRMLKRLAMLG